MRVAARVVPAPPLSDTARALSPAPGAQGRCGLIRPLPGQGGGLAGQNVTLPKVALCLKSISSHSVPLISSSSISLLETIISVFPPP